MRAERLVSVDTPPALVCADRCQVSTGSVPAQSDSVLSKSQSPQPNRYNAHPLAKSPLFE